MSFPDWYIPKLQCTECSGVTFSMHKVTGKVIVAHREAKKCPYCGVNREVVHEL